MENQKFNPVGWFEIYVQDIAKAEKFYSEVLQVQFENLPNPTETDHGMKMSAFPMSMEDIPGASGTLVQMKGMPSGGNSTVIYFTSKDCSVEESRVEKAGGKVHEAKMSIGEYGFISLCLDVDGNMFGIHSMK